MEAITLPDEKTKMFHDVGNDADMDTGTVAMAAAGTSTAPPTAKDITIIVMSTVTTGTVATLMSTTVVTGTVATVMVGVVVAADAPAGLVGVAVITTTPLKSRKSRATFRSKVSFQSRGLSLHTGDRPFAVLRFEV